MQTLYLFSNSRALQQFYTKQRESRLPEALLWSSFLRRFFVCEGKALPTEFRKIFLSAASAQIDVGTLEFDTNFLAFLQDGDFIFPFLDELATSEVRISELAKFDTYDEYGDHLQILQQLYDAYLALLKKYGFWDCTLQKGQLLAQMLTIYQQIEFFVDGFLSVYECNVLEQIAQIVPLSLHFATDCYNLSNLIALSKCTLVANHHYTIDFAKKQILAAKPIAPKVQEICGYAFANPLNQAALCFDTIAKWVASGIDAEDIVIVLPDESFKETLKLFDTYRNLNYAMGQSQRDLPTYQTLQNLYEFLCSPNQTSEIPQQWEDASKINATGLCALQSLKQIFCDDTPLYELLDERCLVYESIAPLLQKCNLAAMLKIILLELSSRRIDDVGGGKVRVMGVLETRGLVFKAVIVLNMNDGLIPRPNDKELFLNTAIRKAAKLPTHKDRENLQKHYYYALLRSAQTAVVSWVDNDDFSESSLILEQEMGEFFTITRNDGEALYQHSFFGKSRESKQKLETFCATIPQNFTLSFSKILSFLQCRNQFYYRYIEQLEPEPNESATLGVLVHRALAHAYKTQKTPKAREQAFYSFVANQQMTPLQSFDFDVAKLYLRNFFDSEQARYTNNIRTQAVEKYVCFFAHGFRIEGFIDRIDIDSQNRLHVIDYKLKKKFSPTDNDKLQLLLYAQALEHEDATEIQTSFYDLYQNKLMTIPHNQNSELLEQTLESLKGEIAFEPKKNAACRYCDYRALCGIWSS